MPDDTPNTPSERPARRWPVVSFVVAIALSAVVTFALTFLLITMFHRKEEARNPYVRVVEVTNNTTDPAPWGRNWPREYDAYKRTVDQERTRYGGSDGAPTESRIERDPWLKRMFLGYAFSIDFRDRRGHAFMLYDQEQTERVTKKPQTGACLHCHASVVPTWRRMGLQAQGKTLEQADGFDWQAVKDGFVALGKLSYVDAHAELLKTPDGTPEETTPEAGGSSVTVKTPANAEGPPPKAPTTQEAIAAHQAIGEAHPVSCVDCHDPENMALRVTRPGLMKGLEILANSDAPVPHLPSMERWRQGDRKEPYNPNVHATRQEMRTFSCAQCHVEYYCGPKTTLFFPWGNGLKVEQIEKFYDDYKFDDNTPFIDFKHAESGARIYKAQHPEFEMWSQGVHARSGVSCADCHMPYKREGATKVSDHWVRSPLLNISRSCQTCHPYPEEELKARVFAIQDRTHALMDRAGKALDALLSEIVAAKQAGVSEQELAPALDLQRKGQWRLDFVNAENSMGFHADQEAARILGESVDYFRQAQLLAQQLRLARTGGRPTTAPLTEAR